MERTHLGFREQAIFTRNEEGRVPPLPYSDQNLAVISRDLLLF
jgi:hypothetical protein